MTGSHVRSLATAATVDTVIVLINVSVIIAIKVYQVPTPACIQDPACNRGPATISTNVSDPQPVCGVRHLSGARLLLEVLWYIGYLYIMKDSITTTWNVLKMQRKNISKLKINDTLLLTPFSDGIINTQQQEGRRLY